MRLAILVISFVLFAAIGCNRPPSQPKAVKIENFNAKQANAIIKKQQKNRSKQVKVAKKHRKHEIRETKASHRS